MAIRDDRLAALEKKASEAEDNFTMVAKTLEAQLIKALDRLQTLEGRVAADPMELRLVLTDLLHRLNAYEKEGEKLAATVEDMLKGIGLDFETLI